MKTCWNRIQTDLAGLTGEGDLGFDSCNDWKIWKLFPYFLLKIWKHTNKNVGLHRLKKGYTTCKDLIRQWSGIMQLNLDKHVLLVPIKFMHHLTEKKETC